MRKLISSIFIASLLYSCNVKKEASTPVKIIKTDSRKVSILFNDEAIPWEIEEDNWTFPYTDEHHKIGIIADEDTLKFDLYSGDSVRIKFVINEQDSVNVMAIGRVKQATFSKAYIDENTGKYEVFSPRVHELVNICVALTDIGKIDSNMVYMESAYHNRVIDHFDKYKFHPFIDSLNKKITEVFGESTYNYYFNIRMNACMYSFREEGIKNDSPYTVLSFSRTNELVELIPLLEDFAKISDFSKFYKENEDYYESLTDAYYKLVPINKMWDWVEERFPQRYEYYKIYYSSLIGGAHSTKSLEDKGFKETIMFIDAPIFGKEYSAKVKEAILTRIVFTEIDHNYVNPTTDSFPELSSLLQPLDCWNNGTQGYNNSYATFNEYMTWAVFTLYLYDNFDKDTFEKRNKIETDFMVQGRGFIKYREFNEFVLNWYLKNSNRSLEDIYPKVIEWIKLQKC